MSGVRVIWRHEMEAVVDPAKLAAAFPEERAEFEGTDAEFVRQSVDVMGADIFDSEWLTGGLIDDYDYHVLPGGGRTVKA